MPFDSGSRGRFRITAQPSSPRNASNASVSCGRPRRQDPTAPSLSQTRAFGTAPSWQITSHWPKMRSADSREQIIVPVSHRE